MSKVITVLIIASVIFGAFSGADLTSAILGSGESAVNLMLTLLGSMTLWGGIMNIAKDSGLWDMLARLTAPLLAKLFKGLSKGSEAIKAISMNLTANMLGLGNAATPLGIKAMKELEKEEGAREKASPNMIKLALMNSCGLQILPTTVATMRLASGSAKPMEILPCVIIVSIMSLTVGLCIVSIFERRK